MSDSMKISKNFPVLKEQNAIVVVSGMYSAKIYSVKDGFVQEKETIHITNPDEGKRKKDGMFLRSGKGMTYGIGSSIKTDEEAVRKKFEKELSSSITKILKNTKADTIYTFSPSHMKEKVKNSIPNNHRNKIKMELVGNLYKLHPTKIFEKIRNHRESLKKEKQIIKPEVKKILEKGKK